MPWNTDSFAVWWNSCLRMSTQCNGGGWIKLKVVSLGIIAASTVANAASAAPCKSSAFSNYLGAGFSCTVGDKTFSSFSFASTASGSGAALMPDDIMIEPEANLYGPGFLFSSGAIAVTQMMPISDDIFVDVILHFRVNAPGPLIDDAALTVAGGASGSGSATAVETISTLPARPVSPMHAWFGSALPSQVTAVVNFRPVSTIDAFNDVLVDVPAGTTGSANITAISQEFSQVAIPEPGSLALLGGALAGLGMFRRRRKPLE